MKINEENINVNPMFAPTYSSAEAIGSDTGFNYEIKPLSLSLQQPNLQYQPNTEKPFKYNPGDTVKGRCPYNDKEYKGIIQYLLYDNENNEQPQVKLVYIFDLESSKIIPLNAETVIIASQKITENFKFNDVKSLNETRRSYVELQQHRYKDDYKSALYDYVTGYTTGVNDILRKNKNDLVITDLLDRSIEKYGNIANIEVYRTVDWNYIKNMYGVTQDNITDFVGKTFMNKGYMSTSSVLKSPWGGYWMDDNLVLHITGKTLYVDVNKIFPGDNEIDCKEQNEYLLPRGVQLKLKSIDFLKGVTYSRKKSDTIYMLNMEIV